ncbi:MAG: hypothetical protein AAGA26_06540, partial [Pseudomonadota bacterium]
ILISGIGAATPVTVVNFSISAVLHFQTDGLTQMGGLTQGDFKVTLGRLLRDRPPPTSHA